MLVSRSSRSSTSSPAACVALVCAGSLLMALAARVALPIGPVPITLQPLAVVLIAALLGSRLGTAAIVAYLAEGAIGLPVFAAGSSGLFGASAGYLWAYPFAVYACARLREAGFAAHFVTRWLANAVALAIVYAGGVAVLAATVGFGAAITVGVLPFLVLDIAKITLAALLPDRRAVDR